jgi:organic hydroperoxide reductase OsmC/OhrA
MTMKCVNGIDLDRLHATRDLIEADADGPSANPKYESTVVWNNGYHNGYRTVSCVTDGQEVIGDEPEQYGGKGSGITPEDMLLTAVGNCLAATYIGELSAAGVTVKLLRQRMSARDVSASLDRSGKSKVRSCMPSIPSKRNRANPRRKLH